MSSDSHDPQLAIRLTELKLRLQRLEEDAAELRQELSAIGESITEKAASGLVDSAVSLDEGGVLPVVVGTPFEDQFDGHSSEETPEIEPIAPDGRLSYESEVSAEGPGEQDRIESGPCVAQKPDIEFPETLAECESVCSETAASRSSSADPEPIPEDDLVEPQPVGVKADTGKMARKPLPPQPPVEGAAASETSSKRRSPLNLELRIGIVWLNRVGLVMLVIALALISRYVNTRLAPWHRVMAGYLFSGALSFAGWWFRLRLRHFARPVMVGGIAAAFFTSFAAHFVNPMACLPLWATLLLMFAATVSLLFCAEGWHSESTAGLGIFLGHSAAFVAGSSAHGYSVIAILFLSIAAVVLFLRQNWLPLTMFSVVAAYASHFLWAIRSRPAGPLEGVFWHNLLFLTSYYVVFLAADLIYTDRLSRLGKTAFSAAQRAAGRAVGPTVLILYATVTIWLFRTTGIYWHHLHWFLLPLAAVQVGVLVFQRLRENPDHPLYATTAVLFFSLALVSLFDGLSLNLALAAEALLLLVASRVLDLWFLNLLAQAVLAVNFVHFWFSSARIINTWPALAGAFATSSVYFVKSRLMETWRRASSLPQGEVTRILAQWTESLSGPLAYVYAGAGAILLAYQCSEFFATPWRALAISVVAAPIAILAIKAASLPMMVAGVVLWLAQLTQLFVLRLQPNAAGGSVSTWLAVQGGIVILAGLAWAAVLVGRKSARPLRLGFGAAGLSIAAFGTLSFSGIGQPIVAAPLWLVLPLILWIETALEGSDSKGDNQVLAGPPGACERFILASSADVRSWLPVAAAVVLWVAVLNVFSLPSHSLAFLSGATVVILAWTLWYGRTPLILGLVSELTLMAFSLIASGEALPKNDLAAWAVPFVAVLAVFGLLRRVFPDGERKAFGFGLAALTIGMGSTAQLIIRGYHDFHPLVLWLLHVAMIWVVIDLVETRKNQEPTGKGKSKIPAIPAFVTMVLSAANAVMLGCVFVRYYGTFTQVLWIYFLVPVLLMVLALVRRNVVSVAGVVGAVATHVALLLAADTLVGGPWAAWSITVEAGLAGMILITASHRWRQGSFAAGGVLSVGIAILALASPLFRSSMSYVPYFIWLAIALAMWVPFEQMHSLPVLGRSSKDWQECGWLDFLWAGGSELSVLFSAITAVVVGCMAKVELSWRPAPLMVVLSLVVFFLIATAVRRSPSLATASGVLLIFAHGLLTFDIGITNTARNYPLLGLALVLLTLLIGAAAERTLEGNTAKIRSGIAIVWFAYGLTFFIGFPFLAQLGLLAGPAWRLPPQMILAVGALVVAWRLRLSRLWVAAFTAVWFVILYQTMTPLVSLVRPMGLFSSGMVIVLLVVVVERICQSDNFYLDATARSRLTMALVAAVATDAMIIFWLAPEMGGHWTTVGWTLVAFVLAGLGFLWHDRNYRRTGLVLFALSLVRATLIDVAQAETLYRILGFFCLGLCLVLVSFLYSRWGKKIGEWF